MRRALAIWLVLVAAYAGTLAVRRGGDGERLTRAEAHRLLTARSIAEDRDVDLAGDYAQQAWKAFTDRPLRPTAEPVLGRVIEPHGIGFPALLALPYALGGVTGAKLACAALSALAFVLAAALGRRIVPEPWPTRAALLAGLSPPALAHAAAVEPFLPGAALVAGAALLALRVREAPRQPWVVSCALLVALAPWLSLHLAVPAAVVAIALARWLRRRQRGVAGFAALEVVLISAVVFVTVHERLVGGPLPTAARSGTSPLLGEDSGPARALRLARVLVDPEVGLLRWAPWALLSGAAVWLLLRSRRDRVAAVVPERVDAEVAAGMLTAMAAASLLAGALVAPSLRGAWLVAPDALVALPALAALSAWGLQRAGRWAVALALLTGALDAWLLIAGIPSSFGGT